MLTKNRKKQIDGVDFNKSYPVLEAIKIIKERKIYQNVRNTWTSDAWEKKYSP